jgi:2-polyprenyl-3-methyl-5-hydroxy-6-metoxy-1,4-benzoquinol methylase
MNSADGASTRIGNFRAFAISRGLGAEANSTDANILRLVDKGKRILELGCGSGHMSQALKAQGCNVVGVEIHPQAAQAAAEICERVIIADLDYVSLDRELGQDRFDVVLAADVLEHLKDPLPVLRSVKEFLSPRGYIVISIPNVAHISIRLALLAGRFPYGETGLLDQTHLRFLTRESLEKLMEDAGLAIGQMERILRVPADPSQFEVPYDPEILPPGLLEKILQDPEALTYQFVLSAYPAAQREEANYQQLIQRIRDLVRSHVVGGGNVLVLSEGDENLVELHPCRGSHFPQEEDGTYAGYHPLDGPGAVRQLDETIRKNGSQFLLIPQTALWWLVEYRELEEYLNRHGTRVIDQPDICVMYTLTTAV